MNKIKLWSQHYCFHIKIHCINTFTFTLTQKKNITKFTKFTILSMPITHVIWNIEFQLYTFQLMPLQLMAEVCQLWSNFMVDTFKGCCLATHICFFLFVLYSFEFTFDTLQGLQLCSIFTSKRIIILQPHFIVNVYVYRSDQHPQTNAKNVQILLGKKNLSGRC